MKLALGYGRITPRHLEVFRAFDCDVVASCNRSAEGRQRAEREGGIACTYARADEMMEAERPEASLCLASIATIHEAALSLLPFRPWGGRLGSTAEKGMLRQEGLCPAYAL